MPRNSFRVSVDLREKEAKTRVFGSEAFTLIYLPSQISDLLKLNEDLEIWTERGRLHARLGDAFGLWKALGLPEHRICTVKQLLARLVDYCSFYDYIMKDGRLLTKNFPAILRFAPMELRARRRNRK